MSYRGYECLSVQVDQGVAFVTFDHPPRNALDGVLYPEIERVQLELEHDDRVRVVVFQSAIPKYFLGGADLRFILEVPRRRFLVWHECFERLRTMSKATIGKIEGITRGGGSEFLLALDMRFGTINHALVSQPEVAIGLIPGGGATQRLSCIVGRSRVLEIILGCQELSAELAERYGYLNQALPHKDLTPFVEQLAYRIAFFYKTSIAFAKAAVEAAELPVMEGLITEADYFYLSLNTKEAQEYIKTQTN